MGRPRRGWASAVILQVFLFFVALMAVTGIGRLSVKPAWPGEREGAVL